MRSGPSPALLAHLRIAVCSAALAAAGLVGAAPADANSTACPSFLGGTCYFGQDLGDGSLPAPGDLVQSMNAESAFRAPLGGAFDTEDFGGFTDGDHGPLDIFVGGMPSLAGVLSDTVASGGTVRGPLDDDPENRGFPTPDPLLAGNLFWKNETTANANDDLFNITFTEGVRAFGFYATAWSTDQSPTSVPATALALYLWRDAGRTDLLGHLEIPHDSQDLPGGVFYFGVITDEPFLALSLRNDSTSDPGDRIGFDQFTVAVVPEPSTALLFAAGLIGLWAFARRARLDPPR